MSTVHDAAQGGAGLLGGAVLALGCLPLLARGPAATRAAFAQAVLLAGALAGRAVTGPAWSPLVAAAALLAAGSTVPRLRSAAGRDAAGGRAGVWGGVAAGLGLVVLGAAAGRQAALLQEAGLRDTLGLALPVLLLGLLAASLRRDVAVRGAALASALHGVALAALGLPSSATAGLGAGPVALAVAALEGLLVAALVVRPPVPPRQDPDPVVAEPADEGIGTRA